MTTSFDVGQRIRLLRLANGLSQVALGEHVGLAGNSQISKIEAGRAAPDERLLSAMATVFDCTTTFLTQGAPADIMATRPWLRAYADAPAKVMEEVQADNFLHYEVTTILGLKRLPERIPRFIDDVQDESAIETYAAEVRASLDIAETAPVRNVMRAAERLGCVVVPLADELGRHLGLSQYVNGVPYMRVARSRPSVPGDRQRFTVAHELGHLALHAEIRPPESAEEARRAEGQAHRFASALLVPGEGLLAQFEEHGGRVTLNTLSHMKAHWGVAIKMLVMRLQQLNLIDDNRATSLYKQISKRGWNTGEPITVSNERAIWLDTALAKIWPSDQPNVNSNSLAQAGVSATYLHRWSQWESFSHEETDATVTQISPLVNDSMSQHSESDARVLPLRRVR